MLCGRMLAERGLLGSGWGVAVADIVGYARVSTRSQSVDSQVEKLEAAGAQRVFVDVGESSRLRDRPQWAACLDYLRRGDTVLVYRLDRLAGSEKMAIETINELGDRGVANIGAQWLRRSRG